MPNQLPEKPENSPPLEDKKKKKIIIGILIFISVVLIALLLWIWQGRRQVSAAPSAYQLELPKGVGREDLVNLDDEKRNTINEQIFLALKTPANKAKITNQEIGQPIIVIITQNNQPILPTSIAATSVPPTAVPPTGVPTPTQTPTSTPTPEWEPTNCLGSSSANGNSCTDSDNGKDYYTKGHMSVHFATGVSHQEDDSCRGTPVKLREWCCVPDGTAIFWDLTCPEGCENGVCKGTPPTPTPTPTPTATPTPAPEWEPTNCVGNSSQGGNSCSDTDNGFDYFTKGTMSVHFATGVSYQEADSCRGGPNKLREWCCVPDGTAIFWSHTCPAGCQNGVCLGGGPTPTPAVPCTDSDGGLNYLVKGTVSEIGDPLSPHTDYCVEVDGISYDKPYLIEYTCENNHWKMNTYDCPNGCQDGICQSGGAGGRGNEEGFSVSSEAQEAYQGKYGSSLIDDVNKIYLLAKQKYGQNLSMKKISFRLTNFRDPLPSYYNPASQEIVFPVGRIPSKEDLTWLVLASLRDDLVSLPIADLNKEVKKLPAKDISNQVFQPSAKKDSPASTVKPTSVSMSPTGKPSSPSCAAGWQDYPKEKYGYKMKIPSGWTAEISPKIEETDSFSEISIISTTRPEEQMDPSLRISSFLIVASKKDIKTEENFQGMFENNSGNQKKSTVDFQGISAEKYVDETETACGGQVNEATNCGHRFEMYYFKKGDFYYLLSLGIYTTPDLKEKNESILKCFLDSFELTQ